MLVMPGRLLSWNITTCMYEELVVNMSTAISPTMTISVVNAEGISLCYCRTAQCNGSGVQCHSFEQLFDQVWQPET